MKQKVNLDFAFKWHGTYFLVTTLSQFWRLKSTNSCFRCPFADSQGSRFSVTPASSGYVEWSTNPCTAVWWEILKQCSLIFELYTYEMASGIDIAFVVLWRSHVHFCCDKNVWIFGHMDIWSLTSNTYLRRKLVLISFIQ